MTAISDLMPEDLFPTLVCHRRRDCIFSLLLSEVDQASKLGNYNAPNHALSSKQ